MLPENIKVRNFDREKLKFQIGIPVTIWLTSRLIVLVSWCISTGFVKSAGLKESFLRWDGGWYFSIEVVVFAIGILGMSFFSSTLGFRPRFVMTAFPLFLGLSAILRTSVQRQIAVSLSVASLSLYSMIVLQLLYQTP
jgi:hypothetical protein